jgi:hypothetical protein
LIVETRSEGVETEFAATRDDTTRSGETPPGTYSTPLIVETKREGVDTLVAATTVDTIKLGGIEAAGGG